MAKVVVEVCAQNLIEGPDLLQVASTWQQLAQNLVCGFSYMATWGQYTRRVIHCT
jgi:hypothetical protein